jgi:hypothetical protein
MQIYNKRIIFYTDANKNAGQAWKALTQQQREEYLNMEAADKIRYEAEIEEAADTDEEDYDPNRKYKVERILLMEIRPIGEIFYRLKWTGYTEPTW